MNLLIFRNLNFGRLWLGQVLSQAGTRMYQIAIMWWILSQYPDNAGIAIGIFLVLGSLPGLLFVNKIGAIVDSASSKKVIIRADLIGFAVAGCVYLSFALDMPNFWIVSVAGFLIPLCAAFLDPTLNKSLGEVVEAEDLEKAVAFQSSTQSLANFGGAVAGAVLIKIAGIDGAILINTLSYLVAALATYFVRFKLLRVDKPANTPKTKASWNVLDEAGLSWVKKLLVAFGLVNFFGTPLLLILPLYTKNLLDEGPGYLGIAEACVWFGMIAGTFLSDFIHWQRPMQKLISLCIFMFGLFLIVPGLIVSKLVFPVALVLAGIALGINNVKVIAFLQQQVDAEIKGRVFALLQAIISFSFPIAFLLFGFLGEYFSPAIVCLIQGSGVMFIAAFMQFLKLPENKPHSEDSRVRLSPERLAET